MFKQRNGKSVFPNLYSISLLLLILQFSNSQSEEKKRKGPLGVHSAQVKKKVKGKRSINTLKVNGSIQLSSFESSEIVLDINYYEINSLQKGKKTKNVGLTGKFEIKL